MKVGRLLVTCVVAVVVTQSAYAENSVTVESKSACVKQDSVTVGIFLTNDVTARHIVLPIEVRAGEGYASVSSVQIGWGGRLPANREAQLGDNVFNHLHLNKDCECGGKLPGYGTLSATDTLPHKVVSLPFGMLLSRLRFVGKDLSPGTDSTEASIVLTMSLGQFPGEIVIDTACVCPNHHLAYIHGVDDIKSITPEFTKGILTVEKCDDDE